MIGVKKHNISFLEEQEEQIGEEANTQNAKFIFYNSDKKFTKQIELYAILNCMNASKVLVVVDKAATIDFLCIKIAEAYDQYPEFKNLEGLKASNLSKRNDQGNEVAIPNSGNLQDYIINGDIIYCELSTNEYWIKTLISMSKNTVNCNKLSMMIEMKVRLDMSFRKFKVMIMKCALNCWLENMKTKKDTYHYLIVNVTFKLSKENDFNINSAKAEKTDSQTIGQLFNFKSEVQCNIVFMSLEEMLMNELKTIKPEERDENAMRWNEFLEVQFNDLSTNKKYDPEYSFIVKYIKRMMIKEQDILQSSSYLFYKNDPKKNNKERDSDHEDPDRFNVSQFRELLSIIVFDSAYFLSKIDKEKDKKNKTGKFKDDYDDDMNNDRELTSSMPYFIFPNKMEIIPSEEDDDISHGIMMTTEKRRRKESKEEDIYQYKQDKALRKITKYRDTSKLSNLRNDFKKFDNNHFLKKIFEAYKISIEKGILESTSMPEFRNYHVLGESIDSSNRKYSIQDISTEQFIKWNNLSIIIFIFILMLMYLFVTIIVFSINF